MFTVFRSYLAEQLSKDALLRSADFRRYWVSSILNGFGGQISALALPLCSVLLLHASPAQMGMMTAAQAIPFALFALPAGVWLDRRAKLPILLASKIVQALTLASVPLGWWLGMLSMPWMYAVAFIMGMCSVVGGGAEQIFLTFMVGRDGLIDAQSKFAATDSASRLIAPGLAGVLIQWLSAPFAILVNAFTFLMSVQLMRKVSVRDPVPPPSDKHPLRDIRDGLAYIWGQPLLRALAWSAGAWHLLFYGYSALVLLFATRELGMSPGVLGTAQMLGGIGVFVSSLLLKPLNKRHGQGTTILLGVGATALGFVLMPTIPAALFGSATASAVAYAALVFFFDCGVMLYFVPYMALRQKVTPDEFLGRMISTMRFLTVATAPLGALAAGYVADHFSIRTGLACVAAGGVALTVAMLLSRPIRSVRP
ncbi:MFS transporter [Massilia sp. MB5]|uniref:MFS transporter n=1 Tax=unclassified Massilia TaxID=2609279 RepID=UPI00067B51ED|nr:MULTISPECIES: MFS transporter [unclassified Massilia]AKU22642.1 MFS transporter [Massilia sp. NR 4-1]UMR32570.1 MFS transporter [Massilia sp. MB5]